MPVLSAIFRPPKLVLHVLVHVTLSGFWYQSLFRLPPYRLCVCETPLSYHTLKPNFHINFPPFYKVFLYDLSHHKIRISCYTSMKLLRVGDHQPKTSSLFCAKSYTTGNFARVSSRIHYAILTPFLTQSNKKWHQKNGKNCSKNCRQKSENQWQKSENLREKIT